MRKILQKLTLLFCLCWTCNPAMSDDYKAKKAETAPLIDGKGQDACWNAATWEYMEHEWFTDVNPTTPQDFQGRYKVTWRDSKIYLLVEIVDDVLADYYTDPLDQYWEDDCLEIFLDEDQSGGEHRFNYNAFAYHIGIKGDVADLDIDQTARLYNNHVSVSRTKQDSLYTWEVAITIFDDTFQYGAQNNAVINLNSGKKMGLSLAYCHSDGKKYRENFIGSIAGGLDSWLDAGLFGSLELLDEPAIHLTSIFNGDTYSSPGSIPISVKTSPSLNITKVEFFAEEEKIGEATDNSFSWVDPPTGDYTIVAKGYSPTDTFVSEAVNIRVSIPTGDVEAPSLNVVTYPNPATDYLICSTNQRFRTVKLSIYDTKGRLLLFKEIKGNNTSSQTTLDVRQLKEGVYILNIQEGYLDRNSKLVIRR